MKRYGQVIHVKPKKLQYYLELHQNPWPEVIQKIKDCNIQNYSIFLLQDHTLFAYFEYVGNDFDGDMAKMAADPETQRWWNTVKPLMQPIETRNTGEFWADMEEIFYLK